MDNAPEVVLAKCSQRAVTIPWFVVKMRNVAEVPGLTAPELAERVSRFHAAASPMNLRGWMLEQDLAIEDADGRLTPTPLAVELGAALVSSGHELGESSLAPFIR